MRKLFRTLLAPAAMGLVLGGCAVSPVKPLYPTESARLRTIDVRVAAPSEPLSVEQLVSSTVVTPVGPGAFGAAGILGAIIGAAIVDAIVTAEAKRNADAMRLELANLADQVRDVDYSALTVRTLQARLHREGSRVIAVGADQVRTEGEKSTAAKTSSADATLFVDVTRAFSSGANPAAGVPPPGAGMRLGIRANVAMLDHEGVVVLRDAIEFVGPRSSDPENAARVAWWSEHGRYRALLERSGHAIAAGIDDVLGTARFPDAAAFDQARAVKPDRMQSSATLERFQTCDTFEGTPAARTVFETYRAKADDVLSVGIVCGAQSPPLALPQARR